jgi:hypothetical protein
MHPCQAFSHETQALLPSPGGRGREGRELCSGNTLTFAIDIIHQNILA